MRLTTSLAAISCAFLLSACGIKGPLHMPPANQSSPPPAEANHSNNATPLEHDHE
ncbi:MAG: lipoprotein [Azoarcus sp.]|jgi:predicted small lipoprotein YifL|nr:lipoprotein [Azoarcus sp.]